MVACVAFVALVAFVAVSALLACKALGTVSPDVFILLAVTAPFLTAGRDGAVLELVGRDRAVLDLLGGHGVVLELLVPTLSLATLLG